MEPALDPIRQHLSKTPPRCARGLLLTPARLPGSRVDSFKTVWRVACPCGQNEGAVLGYPLGRVDPVHNEGVKFFVSPLALDCPACGSITEFLDTDLHGYHSEVARFEGPPGGCKARGEGPRERFPCPGCGNHRFKLIVAFVYWYAAFDLLQDEPHLAGADFFNEFLSYGVCATCEAISAITDFGKL